MLVKGWHASGFLKLLLSRILVCVFVCVPPLRLLITTAPYDWLKKLYSFYMAVIVSITSSCSLSIDVCHRNQPNKSKLVLYELLLSL